MRSRVLSLLLTLLLLVSAVPLASAEVAPRPTSQPIRITGVKLPKSAKAGQEVSVTATVDAPDEGGACCGLVILQGPGSQMLAVKLYPAGEDTLTGSAVLSPYARAGTWKVGLLSVRMNSWKEFTQLGTTTGSHSFTVVNSGKVDAQGPALQSLEVPKIAAPGDTVEIRAKASDDLSGVEYAMVTVQSAGYLNPDGTAKNSRPKWVQSVKLLPAAGKGELSGKMIMEYGGSAGIDGLEVANVTLYDRAGNATMVDAAALEKSGYNRKLTRQNVPVPEWLTTSPDMQVIHAGSLPYTDWLDIDRAYLAEQAGLLAAERQALREYLLAELGQLRILLDQIREEIYTDPDSGLRFVPFATTGKWMVLDQAIAQRNYLLSKTTAGTPAPSQQAVLDLQEEIRTYYRVVYGRDHLEIAASGQSSSNAYAMSYVRLLGSSPELVAALKSPAYQDPDQVLSTVSEFDPGLIYFTPIWADRLPSRDAGWPTLRIPLDHSSSIADHVGYLFYQVGYHVGESLFSHPNDPDRDEWWSEYAALREGQNWSDGAEGPSSLATNLAVDFARTFVPEGTAFDTARAFPDLEGEQKEAFRKLIQDGLQAQRVSTDRSVKGNTQIGLTDRFQVTLKPIPANGSGMMQMPAYSDGSEKSEPAGAFTKDKRGYTYTGKSQTMGDPHWQILWTIDAEWRYQYETMTYIQAPLILDPLPGGTNKPTIKVTGSALPGKVVSAGGHSVQVDKQGRFAIEVPLVPGENEIRLRVSGVAQGVRVRVGYEPEGTAVPFEWAIPDKVTEAWVEGEITTAPYATIVLGSWTHRADADGHLTLGWRLDPGQGLLQVVVTNRYGNSSIWEKTVIVAE